MIKKNSGAAGLSAAAVARAPQHARRNPGAHQFGDGGKTTSSMRYTAELFTPALHGGVIKPQQLSGSDQPSVRSAVGGTAIQREHPCCKKATAYHFICTACCCCCCSCVCVVAFLPVQSTCFVSRGSIAWCQYTLQGHLGACPGGTRHVGVCMVQDALEGAWLLTAQYRGALIGGNTLRRMARAYA